MALKDYPIKLSEILEECKVALTEKEIEYPDNLQYKDIAALIDSFEGSGPGIVKKEKVSCDLYTLSSAITLNRIGSIASYEFIEGIPSNYDMNAELKNAYFVDTLDLSVKKDKSVVASITGINESTLKIKVYHKENTILAPTNLQSVFNSATFSSIDLTHITVEDCTNFDRLFAGCSNLKTIYCNEDWTKVNPKVLEATRIFTNCYELSNFDGTTDGSKAKPISDGGYFTPKVVGDQDILEFDVDDGWFDWFEEMRWDLSNQGSFEILEETIDVSELTEMGDNTWYSEDTGSIVFYNDISKNKDRSIIQVINTDYMGYTLICHKEGTKLRLTNTSNMFAMFGGISMIDLTGAEIAPDCDVEYMFSQCYNLSEIYCNEDWTEILNYDLEDILVFTDCWNLPDYDVAKETAEYAKPTSKGGYFTEK